MLTARVLVMHLVAALLLCISVPAAGSDAQRYLAVFAGGARAEGQRVSGWHVAQGTPRLDDTPLRDTSRPLRWLRDRIIHVQQSSDLNTGLIEFSGGDQLPGHVLAYVAASESGTPAHLVVHTNWNVNHPNQEPRRTVRVTLDGIRTISWGERSREPIPARHVLLRNGRRVAYRRLSWQADALRILTDDGVERITFDNVSQLHLPEQDPWTAYARQLSVLCPTEPSRIIRLETTSRLIATTSQQRFGAVAVVPPEERRVAETLLARLEPRRKSLLVRQTSEQTRFNQKLASLKRKHDQQSRKLENDIRNMRRRMRNSSDAEIERKTADFSKRTKKRITDQMQRLEKTYRGIFSRNMKRHTDRLQDLDKQIRQIKQDHQSLAAAADNSQRWWHMAQPAWSLDPVWMRFDSIRTRWSFAAHEVPLSIIAPTKTIQQSALGYSWKWRADRNARGGTLCSAGKQYGWGFGVHATNQLHFDLPAYATGFRSWVGLDDIAGRGGCVRARIHLNSVETTRPLFQTEPIVGSHKVLDTGLLRLEQTTAGPRKLILVIDSQSDTGPPAADPLDIRDHADWLEPILELDPEAWHRAIQKHVPPSRADRGSDRATDDSPTSRP